MTATYRLARPRRSADDITKSNRLSADHNVPLCGMARDAREQSVASIENAMRVLAMVPRADCALCPHPLDTVAAELRQTLRYLALIESKV